MKRYVFGLIVITALAGAAVAQQAPPPVASRASVAGGIDLAGMDRSVAPGNDFYGFANAGWTRATPIPENRRTFGTIETLTDLSEVRTRNILTTADPKSKIGIAYTAFLDSTAIDARRMEPIKPWFDKLKGMTRQDYPARVAEALGANITAPFAVLPWEDERAPGRHVLMLAQAGLGMPDRDYYIRNSATMSDYQSHLTRLLTILGERDADARAAAVIDFETAIARVSWTRLDRRDPTKGDRRMSRAALAELAPGFDFAALWPALGARDGDLVVGEPSAVTGIARLVSETPVAVLRDQLMVRSVERYADVLPAPFGEEQFAFFGKTLSGATTPQPRWQKAVIFTSAALQDDVARIYAARHLQPRAKAEIDAILANVTKAVDARLARVPWMSPETRRRSRAKLATVKPRLGYPSQWRDYAGLRILPGDAFGNAWRAMEWQFRANMERIGKPGSDEPWGISPMTVNAYTNYTNGEVVITAALLQPPFFDPTSDPAVVYGSAGAAIARQLALYFDATAARYDTPGKATWSQADFDAYARISDALAQQYSAYEVVAGQHLIGSMVVTESAADLAGLRAAYEAWQTSLDGKSAPVIGGLTGDQRFFIAFAQMWRRSYREAALRQRARTDPHAPSEQRVAIVRNMDEWYAAFDVKPGQKLYLPPDQRVRIW